MLVPEFKTLATSPVFSPKINKQMNRTRNQMVRFGMVSSDVINDNCLKAVWILALHYLSRGIKKTASDMKERARRN
jgi:hypothetical protein